LEVSATDQARHQGPGVSVRAPARDAFILDAIRTPRGRGKPGGALHGTKPIDLVAGLIRETLDRNEELDPQLIDDLVLGITAPIDDQGGDLPRAAALVSGLPHSVAGMQMNRFCASGLEAVNVAAQKVSSGWEELILAGGVESMSRVPMGSDGGPWKRDPATGHAISYVPQGVAADLLATVDGFSRDDLDSYAARSHARASLARQHGRFDRSVIPVRDLSGQVVLDHDECVRPNTTAQTLAALTPSFKKAGEQGSFDAVALQKYHWLDHVEHEHTAGSSSAIVDGASLVTIGSASVAERSGIRPRARIVATAVTGADPTLMLTGPAPAVQKALALAGLEIGDVDLFEVNEAFSSPVLRFVNELELDIEKVNVNGGAIAMGHPLGATGAILLGVLLDELERTSGRFGVCTLCVAGGMGIATVIERV
jgi:acetyl-CoA C-acetyltransferase